MLPWSSVATETSSYQLYCCTGWPDATVVFWKIKNPSYFPAEKPKVDRFPLFSPLLQSKSKCPFTAHPSTAAMRASPWARSALRQLERISGTISQSADLPGRKEQSLVHPEGLNFERLVDILPSLKERVTKSVFKHSSYDTDNFLKHCGKMTVYRNILAV